MSPTIPPSMPSLPTVTASPSSGTAPANQPLPSSTGDTVDLSSLGRALAALGQTNQPSRTEGEASGYELPEEAQRLMELIQDLQRQLQEKQQELMQVMADANLSHETKQVKLAEIQASISALTSNLMSAMNQLLQMLEAENQG